jgi:lipopolysaccharide transport system permease protein
MRSWHHAGTMAARLFVREPAAGASARRARERRRALVLVAHLVRRRLESAHRLTALGWLWPLARQLAQLGVLAVLFSAVLDLGIEDYALFVFAGLIVWSWFATAVSAATAALVDEPHLVFSPRLPNIVLPLVAVAVPLVDLLTALPVLLVLLAVDGRLEWTALLLPLLLVVQFGLIAGVSLITSALNVYFRDVQNVVGVGLLLFFYVTPIFYGTRNVPEDYRWLLHVNPMASLVNAVRAVLLDGRVPRWQDVAALCAATAVVLVAGVAVFRRLEPDFVDEL